MADSDLFHRCLNKVILRVDRKWMTASLNKLYSNIEIVCALIQENASSNKFFKVARVVNLKLVFTDDFFYNLLVPIKSCKIQYLNWGRPLLFSRNQIFCLKNWKLWRAPTTIEFNIFCWNFTHVFYLVMSTKACARFF